MGDVVRVRGENSDAVMTGDSRRGDGDRSIDDIGGSGLTTQQTSRSSQKPIKGNFVAVSQSAREEGLTASVAPHLRDGACRDLNDVTLVGCDSKHRPCTAVIAIELDPPACLQDQPRPPWRRSRAGTSLPPPHGGG